MPIQRQREIEGNNSIGTANFVTFAGGTRGLVAFMGDLPSGDLDYFRFSMVAGDVLTLRTSSAFDPILRVLNGTGVELARNDDSDDDRQSFLTYTAPTTATYFVEVNEFSGSGSYIVWTNVSSFNHAPAATSQNIDAIGSASQDNLLFGAGGADTLWGYLGDDVLEGGSGSDVLYGESGNDLALFNATRFGALITQTGPTEWSVSHAVLNTDSLSGIEGLQFQDALVRPLALHLKTQDFSADGRADILWRGAGGEIAVWNLDGGTALANGTGILADNPTHYWRIVATNDFSGDGRGDILFRGNGGEVATWTMSGAQQVGGAANFLPNPGNYWRVAGAADFGGDGRADILWRGQNGEVAIWNVNGTGVNPSGTGIVADNPTNYWTIAATGDFNGDGRADILFSAPSGSVAIWSMNGAQQIGGTSSFFDAGGSYWSVAGAGDFNGDNRSDILWRGQNGEVAIWNMDGTQSGPFVSNFIQGGSATFLPNPTNFWQVADIQDFNGDGRSDILWKGAEGSLYVWHVDGGTVLNTSAAIASPGSYWEIA